MRDGQDGEDSPFHTASATGISDVTCPRKFVFRSLDPLRRQLPKTTGKGALFGKGMHGVAETYHKTGKLPEDLNQPTVRSFLRGLHLNPRPGTHRVEGYFHVDVGGIRFRGYKDLEKPDYTAGIDHKTSYDPSEAVTSLNPEIDPQGLIYAFHACEKQLESNPGQQTAAYEFTWLFYPGASATKAAEPAKLTHVYTSDKLIDQFFEYCYKPALLIAYIRAEFQKNPNPMAFRGNFARCEDYGGCRYKERCNVL